MNNISIGDIRYIDTVAISGSQYNGLEVRIDKIIPAVGWDDEEVLFGCYNDSFDTKDKIIYFRSWELDRFKNEDESEEFCNECDIEIPTYKYNDKKLCEECLLQVLEKEERIRTWTSTHYEDVDRGNYEYLGNDNNNELSDIVEDIANRFKIKKLEE